MRSKLLLLLLIFSFINLSKAQTLDELKALKAEKAKMAADKQGEADKIKGEVAALDSKISILSGWKKGFFGGVGLNLNNSNDWQTNAIKNSAAASLTGAINTFANRNATKYFWNNSGILNLGWLKFDDKDVSSDNTDFRRNTDVLRLASLYGYKLNKWIALSGLGEYSSSFFNFNNPGIADIGFGATLTPIQDLVVVLHPFNYHVGFGSEGISTQSALGAKVRADYARKFKSVSWNSTLTTFLPYQGTKTNAASLFEYTWLNTIGFNLWKGIGVGFTLGLRKADFETFIPTPVPSGKKSRTDVNQSFNTLGLSYSF
jgi:hypothetical protein